MIPDRVRIAAAQYPIELLRSWQNYQDKVASWVAEAVVHGAEILVFPEYAAMDLVAINDRRSSADRRSPTRHTLGSLPAKVVERRSRVSLAWEANCIQGLIP